MEPLDLLAVYGAGLATATTAWTIGNEIRARKPRVRVTGLLSMIVATSERVEALTGAVKNHNRILNAPWRIEVDVVNVGRADAEISEVFVRQQDGSGVRTWRSGNADLPRALKADQGLRVIVEGPDGQVPSGPPLVAVAQTASGKRFESEQFGAREETILAIRRNVLEASLGRSLEDLPGIFVYEVNVTNADPDRDGDRAR